MLVAGLSECRIECKRRARSFATIDGMLADNYALVCRDDRSRPLVVMTMEFVELAGEVRGSATLYGSDEHRKAARRLPF